MRDALQWLQRLQRELERLHRTTAQVLEDSQRLIDDIEKGPALPSPPPPAKRAARGPRRAKRP